MVMGDDRTPAVDAFWRAYCETSGVDPAGRVDVYAFGDSPELADELAELVLTGPKRATAGLLDEHDPATNPVPEPGVHSVILDGRGEPVCVVRTTDVQIKPLREADAAFAWDEGEGDRTLEYWMAAHRRFFTRTRAAEGRSFSDDELVVYERFELVWPLSSQAPAPD
jgi:uncharacterized protein YhfF